MSGVANAIISPIGSAVNGVISGVNWILGKVGSSKSFAKWQVPKFANGSEGLPEWSMISLEESIERWLSAPMAVLLSHREGMFH